MKFLTIKDLIGDADVDILLCPKCKGASPTELLAALKETGSK